MLSKSRVQSLRHRATETILAAILLVGSGPLLADDRIVLRTGGEILGRVVAEEGTGGDKLLTIELDAGGTLKLLRTQIQTIEETTEAELQYRERVTSVADTAESHWELAEWCREQKLRAEQERHLLKVIQLDPEHEDARHALGYSRVAGVWATRAEVLRRNGRRSDGMLVEEFEIEQYRQGFELRQKQLNQELRRLRSQLGKARHAEAVNGIQAMAEPAAVQPLRKLIGDEMNRDIKLLLLDVLIKIDSYDSVSALIDIAMFDQDEQVREIALKTLQAREDPTLQREVMVYLDPNKNDPATISRAGVALSWLGDSAAVRSMIEALETKHVIDNPNAQNPGAIGANFGNTGGGGFQFGGGQPQKRLVPVRNEGVRAGLQRITGVDYGFNKEAWLAWYSSQKTPALSFDLRRDD